MRRSRKLHTRISEIQQRVNTKLIQIGLRDQREVVAGDVLRNIDRKRLCLCALGIRFRKQIVHNRIHKHVAAYLSRNKRLYSLNEWWGMFNESHENASGPQPIQIQ